MPAEFSPPNDTAVYMLAATPPISVDDLAEELADEHLMMPSEATLAIRRHAAEAGHRLPETGRVFVHPDFAEYLRGRVSAVDAEHWDAAHWAK